MEWYFYVFWIVSALCFIGGLIYFFKSVISLGNQKKRRKTVVGLTILVGAAVFSLRLAVLLRGADAFGTFIRSIGGSIVHTLQTFSLDEDYDKFVEAFRGKQVLSAVYTVYCVLLNVLAPIMTLAFIVSLLEEVFSRLSLHCHRFREKFIFSEINELTVTLAEDIRKNNKKAYIVFTDAFIKEDDELAVALRERARAIRAVCVKDDVMSMHLSNSPFSRMTFILADMHESENLRVAAWLAEADEKTNKAIARCEYVNVLVICGSEDADNTLQAVIDKRLNRNMRFIPINYSLISVYDLLLRHPLYARMDKDGKGEKTCSVLIVGCGSIGLECVKAISWCGQMPDTKLKINVVSADADVRKTHLNAAAPELLKDDRYGIRFHQIDVKSDAFIEFVRNNAADACFVAVAMGDEQQNINVANALKRLYDGLHLTGGVAPQICFFVVDDNILRSVTVDNKNLPAKRCLMVPFGNNEDLFRMEKLCSSALEKEALSVHLTYWGLPIDPDDAVIEHCKRLFLKGASPCAPKKKAGLPSDPEKAGVQEKYVSRRYENELIKRCFGSSSSRIFLRLRFLRWLHGDRSFPGDLRELLAVREGAISGFFDSIYGQYSSRSSAIHLQYKLAAMNFDPVSDDDDPEKRAAIAEEAYDGYNEFIKVEKNRMAVAKLEHLRWNAYMRSIGYKRPDEETFRSYAYLDGNNQVQKRVLLHPCLVEWDPRFDVTLKKEDYGLFERKDPAFMEGRYQNELDDLDRVSLNVWLLCKERKNKDKPLDYKTMDIDIIVKAADILRCAKGSARYAELI